MAPVDSPSLHTRLREQQELRGLRADVAAMRELLDRRIDRSQ